MKVVCAKSDGHDCSKCLFWTGYGNGHIVCSMPSFFPCTFSRTRGLNKREKAIARCEYNRSVK